MKNQELKTNDSSWVDLITVLSDLVVFSHYDFKVFLQKLIAIVINVVPVDSCLIYVFDRDKDQLILIGSKKPHNEELGKIVLHEGEGITGWVAQHKQTVAIEKKAYEDRRFKPFKELPEDRFESFLSVPIIDVKGVIGVINLQNNEPYTFSQNQIKAIEAIVKIISSAFANITLERQVDHLKNKLEERKILEKAKGVLMKARKMDENEAFHFIRKEAMEKRKSMKDVAEAILLVLG